MRNFRVPEKSQILLFANIDLHTAAPIGSAVYTIDKLVDELDTKEIEGEYDLETTRGNEPFHPKTLIKVALFAIHNCRFSLRKIEYDTVYNPAYRWLTGDKGIDHSTMGKFLVNYKNKVIELFLQIVEIGVEKGLVDFEMLAIDSVKIRANASYKEFRTLEGIEKEKEKIRIKLSELIDKINDDNAIEIEILKKREDCLEEAKAVLKERIKEKTKEASEAEAKKIEKKEKINLTDFDCIMVQQANGEINPGYSITTSTDTGSDFITYFQVNEINNDAKALNEVIEGSENETEKRHDVVLADSGFFSISNCEELEEKGQSALIPDKRLEVEQREETAKGEFDRSKFTYDEKKDEYECPKGAVLSKVGSYKKDKRTYNRYANSEACKECKYKEECTKGKHRVIVRDSNEACKERMRKAFVDEVNQEKYKKRAHSAESPFGQIKHNLKYRIFMRRTKEKVKMECALLIMLHNILKIGKVMSA